MFEDSEYSCWNVSVCKRNVCERCCGDNGCVIEWSRAWTGNAGDKIKIK